jgi:CDP-diacylglycerol--glycerol-3-phosphate 3-phosphatidyltransferase
MNIANKISTFRILIVPFFIACLLYSQEKIRFRSIALIIFCLAVLSDAVDGYIARKSKQISKAGAVLDPLGDKLLLMSAFFCLALIKEIPFWVAYIIISRDTIILLGTLVVYIVKQHMDIFPTKWGKFTTTFQMLSVICVLLKLKYAHFSWWIAIFFTVISGIDYIMRGFKILYATDNHRAHH